MTDSTERMPDWFAFIETQGKRLSVGWFLGYSNAEVAAQNALKRHGYGGAYVVDWRDAASYSINGEA